MVPFLLSGQKNLTESGLGVGRILPLVPNSSVYNYTTEKINIADFKGKLIIIDFWASWCSPCIAGLPKLDRLQYEFKERVQILPVTYQDVQSVKTILKNMFEDNTPSILPYIYNDQVFHTLFPHRSLPHCIWIGPEGEILAITESNQVTAENLNKILKIINEGESL